ncbi:alpha/beta hydrolase [Gordonia sp. TBRC 11910]|uniref:Alpha/beta hydrolase n=1 Tax=Gordonia asplenii TaxID=2725283 RepID=A0A848L729_9ACTN|nr:alpha/beta hydrolase [Gordonia asplenii]NMO03408.1 alpha/beta hydrolase [Gordonia asplenii]
MNLDINGTQLTVADHGDGFPILLLHGGGGPQTVATWGEELAETRGLRVIVPTHPGFAGTPRPTELRTIGQLAELYVRLLDALDATNVLVVGNSIGGWITAEMAILASPRVRGYVIVNGTGVESPGNPVADFFSLTPDEIARYSYANPVRFGLDPTKLAPAARQMMTQNRATLEIYGGTTMTDPTLGTRLATVSTPTLVVWGEADRIAPRAIGDAFVDSIPGADFELMRDAGHLPQIEQPTALADIVERFGLRVR